MPISEGGREDRRGGTQPHVPAPCQRKLAAQEEDITCQDGPSW